MKGNVKTLLIVFLVALLGSGIGTFGVLELKEGSSSASTVNDLQIQQVSYEPSAGKNDTTKAIEKAYDTVVEIRTEVTTQSFFGKSTATGLGSGVIISSDGYIVTNHHVVNDSNNITVTLSTGEIYGAVLVGSDSRTDIALIKIDAEDLPYSVFVDSDKLEMGQEVVAIGNPLGHGVTCSTGIISGLEKEILLNNVYMDLIQTDASINEGNSGGGLFDINGDLIGIVNAKSSSSYYSSTTVEGMGYAIPANRVLWVIESLKEYGYVKDRATIGVSVGTSPVYVQPLEKYGLLIMGIQEGGGAEKAGLRENDVILEADGRDTTSYADLNRVLDKHDPGDTITLHIYRESGEMDVEVTLTQANQ